MNGVTDYIRQLKKAFQGKFLITQEVKYEIVDKPMKINRFRLEALKLKGLIDDGTLEFPPSVGIKEPELRKKAEQLLEIANSTFSGSRSPVKILDIGETSCLALSTSLTEKGIKNVLAIDERTTRLLVEKPENLIRIFENRMNIKITPKPKNYSYFKGIQVIRSTELVYVAYKKDLIKFKGKNALDALLYAMKSKGAAISNEEIEEIKKIG
jgi:hypothetical protein